MNKCYICHIYLQMEWKSTLNLTPQSYRGRRCPEVNMHPFCPCFIILFYFFRKAMSCEMLSNSLKAPQLVGELGLDASTPWASEP